MGFAVDSENPDNHAHPSLIILCGHAKAFAIRIWHNDPFRMFRLIISVSSNLIKALLFAHAIWAFFGDAVHNCIFGFYVLAHVYSVCDTSYSICAICFRLVKDYYYPLFSVFSAVVCDCFCEKKSGYF